MEDEITLPLIVIKNNTKLLEYNHWLYIAIFARLVACGIKKLHVELLNPEMSVRLTDHHYIMVLKTMLNICIKQRFTGFDTSNRNKNKDMMALTTQSIH